MLARLRENIQFKLLALAVAILLHMYVSNQQNPSQTHTLTVPLTVKDIPPGMLLTSKPGSVMVTVSGSSDEMAKVSEVNFTALVDLRRARPGANPGLPVDVEVSPAALRSTINWEIKPRVVNLQLDERRQRRMSIGVEVTGTSSSGFVARRPSILVPSMATVSGPATEVDSVIRLVVRPDITGAHDNIDDDYEILPLDAQGNEVPAVQVTPETAHVQINIVQAGRTKQVFISPKITGAPAPGYVIGTVTVNPETVEIVGANDLLTAADSASTDPIDITGAAATVTKQVHCVLPTGLSTATTASTVTVTVAVVPAGTPPNPTAAPAHP